MRGEKMNGEVPQIFLSDMGGEEHLPELLEKTGAGLETIRFSIADNLDRLDETIRGTRVWLEKLGRPPLSLHGPFLDPNPACYDSLLQEAVRTRFEQAYEAARELGACRLVLHSGRQPGIYRFDSYWVERMIRFFGRFMENRSGVAVCLENVLDERARPLLAVAEGVDHPDFGLCLDLGHANCYSQESPEEWIGTLGSRIRHVHIHDNDGREDAHKAAGTGNIDFRKLIPMITAFSGGVSWTIECAGREELAASWQLLTRVAKAADGRIPYR